MPTNIETKYGINQTGFFVYIFPLHGQEDEEKVMLYIYCRASAVYSIFHHTHGTRRHTKTPQKKGVLNIR